MPSRVSVSSTLGMVPHLIATRSQGPRTEVLNGKKAVTSQALGIKGTSNGIESEEAMDKPRSHEHWGKSGAAGAMLAAETT